MLRELFLIIISYGIVQSFIFIFIFLRKEFTKAGPNKILVLFLLVIALGLFGRFFLLKGYIKEYPHVYLIIDILFYLYGPLFYLYVKYLLTGNSFKSGDSLHFIPAAVHFLSMLPLTFISPAEYSLLISRGKIWQYPYDWALAIIHIAIYIFLSFKIIGTYEKSIKNYLSYDLKINYLKKLLYLMILFLSGWFHSFLVEVFRLELFVFLYRESIFMMILPLLPLSLAYYSIKDKKLFLPDEKEIKYTKSTLTEIDIERIKKNLESCMKTVKPYLNPGLSIEDLALSINSSIKDLSRVINESYHSNFYNFINRYRVEHFKMIVSGKNGNKQNILSIAYESGFNSKSTFNAAFKRVESITPSEYLKQEQNRL